MCPPHRYEAIKASLKSRHPDMPLAEVKTHAAKIYQSSRQPGELELNKAVSRERAKKVKGIGHRRNF